MPDGSAGQETPPDSVGSGIAGLDEILGRGFPADRLHLVEGAPGTGKTTLALQFLLAGARQIVEQHGGRMCIASVEGSGTTATVHLPLSETAGIASQAP